MGYGSELALDNLLETVEADRQKTSLEFLNNYLQLKRLFAILYCDVYKKYLNQI